MRLQQWIADKTLTRAARKLYDENKTFREMLEVLESEHPLTAPLGQQGPSADDRSYRLGLIEGYAQCLRTFAKLWSPPVPPPLPLTATFEPPE